MSYDPVETVTRELRLHGITEWSIETPHAGHTKIRFVHQGKPITFVVPCSPSDRRGWRNSLTKLRQTLGVKRIIVKNDGPRRARNRTEPNVTLTDLTFAVRPDPFLVLAALAERMEKSKC